MFKNKVLIEVMVWFALLADFCQALVTGGIKIADRFWNSVAALAFVTLFFIVAASALADKSFSTLDPNAGMRYFKLTLLAGTFALFCLAAFLRLITQPISATRSSRDY